MADVKNVKNPQDGVKAGLIYSSDENKDIVVPLKSVHVQAQLLDLVAKVT